MKHPPKIPNEDIWLNIQIDWIKTKLEPKKEPSLSPSEGKSEKKNK